jgi:hypothetical protein
MKAGIDIGTQNIPVLLWSLEVSGRFFTKAILI